MIARLLPLFIVFFVIACEAEGEAPQPHDPDEEEWIELFNGEDLTGWDLKFTGYELNDNIRNTFRVEDSLLKVSYDEWDSFDGEFGHIFYEEPFSHYHIRVEYRFVGEQLEGGPNWAYRNNGVMMHSQSAETMECDQIFPRSVELQLLGGDGETERPNGNLCIFEAEVMLDGELVSGGCHDADAPTYHGNQWVTAESIVLGDSLVQHILEDEVVLEYTDIQLAGNDEEPQPLREGQIALQAETHPTEFRRVELLNLKGCTDPEATNYKSYYVEPDNAACEY